MHAINLLTRLNWESRVAASSGHAIEQDATVRRLANELADYLLFAGEAPPLPELTPRAGFRRQPRGENAGGSARPFVRAAGLVDRLLRYPCSYMVYSDAFDGLPTAIKSVVYQRMIESLVGDRSRTRRGRIVPADARRAALEILRDTKPDFPSAVIQEISVVCSRSQTQSAYKFFRIARPLNGLTSRYETTAP